MRDGPNRSEPKRLRLPQLSSSRVEGGAPTAQPTGLTPPILRREREQTTAGLVHCEFEVSSAAPLAFGEGGSSLVISAENWYLIGSSTVPRRSRWSLGRVVLAGTSNDPADGPCPDVRTRGGRRYPTRWPWTADQARQQACRSVARPWSTVSTWGCRTRRARSCAAHGCGGRASPRRAPFASNRRAPA
jgi:hypothetical protein